MKERYHRGTEKKRGWCFCRDMACGTSIKALHDLIFTSGTACFFSTHTNIPKKNLLKHQTPHSPQTIHMEHIPLETRRNAAARVSPAALGIDPSEPAESLSRARAVRAGEPRAGPSPGGSRAASPNSSGRGGPTQKKVGAQNAGTNKSTRSIRMDFSKPLIFAWIRSKWVAHGFFQGKQRVYLRSIS